MSAASPSDPAIEERAMAAALGGVLGVETAKGHARAILDDYHRLRSEAMLRTTTDARIWAAELMAMVERHGGVGQLEDLEGVLVGWFANAIETAKDLALGEQPAHACPVPAPRLFDDEETARELIGQAIGEASMCWEPAPSTQTFDSSRAAKITDKLLTDLLTVQAEVIPPAEADAMAEEPF